MSLQRSLDEWRRMIGSEDDYDHIQVSDFVVAGLRYLSLTSNVNHNLYPRFFCR